MVIFHTGYFIGTTSLLHSSNLYIFSFRCNFLGRCNPIGFLSRRNLVDEKHFPLVGKLIQSLKIVTYSPIFNFDIASRNYKHSKIYGRNLIKVESKRLKWHRNMSQYSIYIYHTIFCVVLDNLSCSSLLLVWTPLPTT